MASTLFKSMMSNINLDAAGIFPNLIGNEVTATNAFGNVQAYVIDCSSASDVGFHGGFSVPGIYSTLPKVRVIGVLDVIPGASDVLGFGIQGLSVADNESADQAFSTEDLKSETIGSSGLAYASEDLLVMTIDLSNLGPVANEFIFFHWFMDASVTTYTSNFIFLPVEFQYDTA